MHRDTQIGLAMSIVLIGFAAALCFPRDASRRPADAAAGRAVETSLSDLPVRVYGPAQPAPAKPAPTAEPAVQPPTPTVGEFAASPPPPRTPTATASTPVDPPIAMSAVQHPSAVQPDIVQSIPVQPVPTRPLENELSRPEVQPEAPAATKFHVVESGDTLSGLAQKYLGSVARYPEIYAANRDQLDTPDDLKLGMRLRIPATTARNPPD
ncbi:MAG: LysM peptidoglycan-binding domain-containing protein [Planctomycetaceae bacterium]